jgi:hypothetical protein
MTVVRMYEISLDLSGCSPSAYHIPFAATRRSKHNLEKVNEYGVNVQ